VGAGLGQLGGRGAGVEPAGRGWGGGGGAICGLEKFVYYLRMP
jgi:hypothetical protein